MDVVIRVYAQVGFFDKSPSFCWLHAQVGDDHHHLFLVTLTRNGDGHHQTPSLE
jgi:hypothetical protein